MLGAIVSLNAVLCTLFYPAPSDQTAGSVGVHETWDAAQLYQEILKVRNVPRVLYVAAHPDDENTALIAYLSRALLVDVAYLSLTRGSGGQNIIGAQQGDLLGVVRTQELLAARRIDGARQFFTRARDFGFSKSAEESLERWNAESVLDDVVQVIRHFRPHVIITRFPEEGETHGHHLASARLARLAFAAAADASYGAKADAPLPPWQATRLVYNVPRWMGQRGGDARFDFTLDVNVFIAHLGQTVAQIAASSRTMHKSQGFGSAAAHGPVLEAFRHVAGMAAKQSLLEGIETTLQDLPGGHKAAAALLNAAQHLSPKAPHAALGPLFEAYHALDTLDDAALKAAKRAALGPCLLQLLGVQLDMVSSLPQLANTAKHTLTLRAANHGTSDLLIVLSGAATPDFALPAGAFKELPVPVPADDELSVYPWLRPHPSVYELENKSPLAWPSGLPGFVFDVAITAKGLGTFNVLRTARAIEVDRVFGERAAPVQRVPPVVVTPLADVGVTRLGEAATVWFDVTAKGDAQRIDVTLPPPPGWSVMPSEASVVLARTGDRQRIGFEFTPSASATPFDATAKISFEGFAPAPAWREDVIDFSHLPPQRVLRPATVRLSAVDAASLPQRVGYVMGSGDDIPQVLRQLGVRVEEIDDATLRSGNLSAFDVIVLGPRVLNVRQAALDAYARLMDYVERGGHLVEQYNTNAPFAPLKAPVGPYPFVITRERITNENAPVTFLLPEHPVLHHPHEITAADFEGYVQERGLYFAGDIDTRYECVFSMADANEAPSRGSLIVTRFGKGTFIYTGLAFFRQLPAGVPGAIRLFLNLLAYT